MTTDTMGAIGARLGAGATAAATAAPASPASRPATSAEPLLLVPAGFIADIVGGLSGTLGELTGDFFGNAPLGKQIGEAASPLIKLLPFQVIAPPAVAPQSGGPDAAPAGGTGEPMVIVPAAFLGGLLGGIGGTLLGGTVGQWLGNQDVGKTVGSTVGGILGGLLPFQVVPPSLTPQSFPGPEGEVTQEPMVVVPAGFFGNLLSGLSSTVGGLVGGASGQQLGAAASPFLQLLPFQDVPADLLPQSTGPDSGDDERMIVVPAGFFGNLLSGLAGTIGGAVGGMFGDSQTGQNLGNVVAPVLSMIPFHAVPANLLPQSATPAGSPAAAQQEMMFVPAGLFGSLLSGLAGTIGGAVGGLFGDARTGQAVGTIAAPILNLIPFQVVAPSSASSSN